MKNLESAKIKGFIKLKFLESSVNSTVSFKCLSLFLSPFKMKIRTHIKGQEKISPI